MKKFGRSLTAYGVAHFVVDFTCAFSLYHVFVGKGNLAVLFLLYNFCAFALQMPIGLLADAWNRNSIVAGIGCCLVALGTLVSGIPMLFVTMLGVGNAMFHVGGGIDVLNHSTRKAAPLGVFVSPGAFGIYFGTTAGTKGAPLGAVVFVSLVILAMLLPALTLFLGDERMSLSKRGTNNDKSSYWTRLTTENVSVDIKNITNSMVVCSILCFFVVVILRSYMGLILTFPWKTGGWSIAFVCAIVFGKTAGGFLADWIGIRKATVASLVIAAIAFCFSDIPAIGILAVFCFQMTMPITLWAAAKLLPGCKGFAFGLLTFALFIGYLPSYIKNSMLVKGQEGFVLITLISLIALGVGLYKMKREELYEEKSK